MRGPTTPDGCRRSCRAGGDRGADLTRSRHSVRLVAATSHGRYRFRRRSRARARAIARLERGPAGRSVSHAIDDPSHVGSGLQGPAGDLLARRRADRPAAVRADADLRGHARRAPTARQQHARLEDRRDSSLPPARTCTTPASTTRRPACSTCSRCSACRRCSSRSSRGFRSSSSSDAGPGALPEPRSAFGPQPSAFGVRRSAFGVYSTQCSTSRITDQRGADATACLP